MIPVGYMYKKVHSDPKYRDWIGVEQIKDIYSVANCVSVTFADGRSDNPNDKNDYIHYWKHNGFWFFDSPSVMETIARDDAIDLSSMTLFFYEAYEKQWDDENDQWILLKEDASFSTSVRLPDTKTLHGFDVVTFSYANTPECSPLSCNALANTIPVNEHCLLNTLEEAIRSLESGLFDNSEPGPFRIFAVYTV